MHYKSKPQLTKGQMMIAKIIFASIGTLIEVLFLWFCMWILPAGVVVATMTVTQLALSIGVLTVAAYSFYLWVGLIVHAITYEG